MVELLLANFQPSKLVINDYDDDDDDDDDADDDNCNVDEGLKTILLKHQLILALKSSSFSQKSFKY